MGFAQKAKERVGALKAGLAARFEREELSQKSAQWEARVPIHRWEEGVKDAIRSKGEEELKRALASPPTGALFGPMFVFAASAGRAKACALLAPLCDSAQALRSGFGEMACRGDVKSFEAALSELDAQGPELAAKLEVERGLSAALAMAAQYDQQPCLSYLLGRCDALDNSSFALRVAARTGSWGCARRLSPASDPSAQDFEALRWALADDQAEFVALWAPLMGAARVAQMVDAGDFNEASQSQVWARSYLTAAEERSLIERAASKGAACEPSPAAPRQRL